MTLGFLWWILHREKITNLTDEQIDLLITGICLGLNNFDKNSFTALENIVNFPTKSLKKELDIDFFMNLLVSTFMKGIKHQQEGIVYKSILSLTMVSQIIYHQFEKYHILVFRNIIKSLSFLSKPILFASNEFFLSLSKIE